MQRQMTSWYAAPCNGDRGGDEEHVKKRGRHDRSPQIPGSRIRWGGPDTAQLH